MLGFEMSLCGGGSGVLFRVVGGGAGCRINAAAVVEYCARQLHRDTTANSVRESFSEDSRKGYSSSDMTIMTDEFKANDR